MTESPVTESKVDTRPIRSFHSRRGRVRPTAAAALERLWPIWGIPYSEDVDINQVFADYPQLMIEIGCGLGEATLDFALKNPETGVLAIDVHRPGLGVLLRECEKHSVANVRVMDSDAVAILQNCVTPESVDEFRIFFPDPWPKSRHNKRRLIQPLFVQLVSSRLRLGGRLHLATDWQDYADQMLEVVSNEPTLRNEFDGFAPRPDSRIETRFERKGLNQGHAINDLILTRI